jgi:hypothetical protein
MKTYVEVGVWLHEFLTSVLDEGSDSFPASFPFGGELDWTHSGLNAAVKRKVP